MSTSRFSSQGPARHSASHLDEDESATTACQTDYEAVLLGDSLAARRLRSQVQRIAPYLRTALIRGEPGTGKQLVARAIHAHSPGAQGPFVILDASELAQSLVGRDVPQALIAAASSVLESAHGGTLYLSGVGGLSSALQAGLLQFIRALEDGRTGAATDRRIEILRPAARRLDTRILASSSRDLRTLAAVGQFRQDLYTKLSVVEILVPPLRQRMEDLPVLTRYILRRFAEASGEEAKMLAGETLSKLQHRPWPDNLRELEHVVAQAANLADGPIVGPRHLLTLVEPAAAQVPEDRTFKVERLDDVVQRHVVEVLSRCGGNKLRTAELLGISRSTLYRMLDAHSASPELLQD